MKLIQLPLKNVVQNWWRSLTLGSFLLIACMLFVFFNSFILTIKLSVEEALVNALTGHVQIRPSQVKQMDTVAMDADWGVDEYLTNENVEDIVHALVDKKEDEEAYIKRVRHNVILQYQTQKVPAMIMGMNPETQYYHEPFQLTEGRFLSSEEESGEMVLSQKLADQLKVHVGEELTIMSINIRGESALIKLIVVGIGNLQRLSGYGTDICYMDIDSARVLKGLQKEEATDIIVYTSDKDNASSYAKGIKNDISEYGEFTVTSWDSQGGYIRTVNIIYFVMFYIFIAILLFIICILIINLVFMIALERRQEIGTLRAIGFSKWRIIGIFMLEITIVSFIFCGIGVAIGSGAAMYLSSQVLQVGPPWDGILGNQFIMTFHLAQSLPGIIIILIFTCLAAFYPAFKVTSVKAADIINEK